MLFRSGDPLELESYLAEAKRLLRIGGALALVHSLAGGGVTDPAARDAATVSVRAAVAAIAADPAWRPVVLPLGDGLLVAVRQPED